MLPRRLLQSKIVSFTSIQGYLNQKHQDMVHGYVSIKAFIKDYRCGISPRYPSFWVAVIIYDGLTVIISWGLSPLRLLFHKCPLSCSLNDMMHHLLTYISHWIRSHNLIDSWWWLLFLCIHSVLLLEREFMWVITVASFVAMVVFRKLLFTYSQTLQYYM